MTNRPDAQPSLLFLCTGNYYRSRFAEVLFNTLISQTSLRWSAYSRGIAIELGIHNVGPISKHAMHGLHARGVYLPDPLPFPQQVQEQDLKSADLIIALKEAEHRPLLEERFPQWVGHIEFWHIHDLDQASADITLVAIEREVQKLLLRLTEATPS